MIDNHIAKGWAVYDAALEEYLSLDETYFWSPNPFKALICEEKSTTVSLWEAYVARPNRRNRPVGGVVFVWIERSVTVLSEKPQ